MRIKAVDFSTIGIYHVQSNYVRGHQHQFHGIGLGAGPVFRQNRNAVTVIGRFGLMLAFYGLSRLFNRYELRQLVAIFIRQSKDIVVNLRIERRTELQVRIGMAYAQIFEFGIVAFQYVEYYLVFIDLA